MSLQATTRPWHGCLLFAALVWLLAGLVPVQATAADLVAEWFAGLESIQADFSQTVVDSAGEQVQDSQGQVWIQRPGRFRWDYRTPYRQLIVSDGKQLWTYDEDLEQATVKDLDAALGSTPALLLSGYRPLSEVMTWAPDGEAGGKNWFRLQPRKPDSSVESVRIGFSDGQLDTIEVVDGFGNHTQIRFAGLQRNQTLDDELFHLKLPPGTDIIGAQP
jgi:outer membrane lipoprotein carrier protein